MSGIAVTFFSCAVKEKNNQLTDEEKKDGWVLLFDGKSTDGWHLYNRGKVPSVWIAKDDELYCDADSKREQGDLTSDKEFENFDLQFDWKIEKRGNSGVFINVIERPDIKTTYASGPEYQISVAASKAPCASPSATVAAPTRWLL